MQSKDEKFGIIVGPIDSLSSIQTSDLFPGMDSQELRQLFEKSEPLPASNMNTYDQIIPLENFGMEDFQHIHDAQNGQNHLKHLTEYPEINDIVNDIGFNIILNSEDTGKSTWVYSAKVDKVFIKMDTTFAFLIEYKPFGIELFLRAMIVYTSNDALHNPVKRCSNHQNQPKKDETPETAFHVLRSPQPNAKLLGKPDGTFFGERLCVYIPLSFKDEETARQNIRLEFACQNSCNGINRRSTAIIFTLEDADGTIWGRRYLPFKVCSCPKRDKEKEERAKDPRMPKKRKAEDQMQGNKRPAKFVTMLSNIKQEIPSTNVVDDNYRAVMDLPDKKAVSCVFRFALGYVSTILEELPENDENRKKYQSCKDELRGQLDNLRMPVDSD